MTDTMTISMRIPRKEAADLEAAARSLGLDKGAFFKLALRQGSASLLMEQSSAAYRRGDITLSRAAEISGVSIHEFIARMGRSDLHLNYGVDDLETDIPSR